MNFFSKFLFISFLVITVIFGLDQLSYVNTVFADSRLPCCQNSGCDAGNCGTAALTKDWLNGGPFCTDNYQITCQECVDLTALGEVCLGPRTAYCYIDNDPNDCYGWCDGVWVLSK